MQSRPKAWMVWSSGKDSAWALHVARQAGEVDVVGLLTTITDAYARVSMHGAREFDLAFLSDLPAGVGPCAENGEFHTFAWDLPDFAAPITVSVGETVEREGFVFTDLVHAVQERQPLPGRRRGT